MNRLLKHEECGPCQMKLGVLDGRLVLLITFPKELPALLPRRFKRMRSRAERGCRGPLADAEATHWDEGLRLTWPEGQGDVETIQQATALFSRLAAALFAPITAAKAQSALAVPLVAPLMPAPSATIRAARHGKSYPVRAYRISEYLALATAVQTAVQAAKP